MAKANHANITISPNSGAYALLAVNSVVLPPCSGRGLI